MATALSPAELIFAQRMLPPFMAGKSAAEAAKAVLADDERLFIAFLDRSHSYHIPTADERGRSGTTRQGTGDVIARELTGAVYARLRAA
jgi:hypothetical protein